MLKVKYKKSRVGVRLYKKFVFHVLKMKCIWLCVSSRARWRCFWRGRELARFRRNDCRHLTVWLGFWKWSYKQHLPRSASTVTTFTLDSLPMIQRWCWSCQPIFPRPHRIAHHIWDDHTAFPSKSNSAPHIQQGFHFVALSFTTFHFVYLRFWNIYICLLKAHRSP